MKPFSVRHAVEVTNGAYSGPEALLDEQLKNVVIDSAKCSGGELFVPVRGARFDGHVFIEDAFRRGAVLTLSEKPVEGRPYVLVPDTVRALQELARDYREQFTMPVIVLTGSVGKTTTKEMIAAMLETRFRVHRNVGNLNNQTGLPQTIFTMDDGYDVSVMEVGTNHYGEIEPLSRMAEPDVCLFTNIGISHIENFGSREGIFREKSMVLSHARQGVRVIVNGDDDLLSGMKHDLSFGCAPGCEVGAEDVEDLGLDGVRFTLRAAGGRGKVHVRYPGRHLVDDAAAAASVGVLMGLKTEEICRGLEAYRPYHGRMDVIRLPRLTIVDDTYNAVLASGKNALDLLGGVKTRRVAVLGDMRELGGETERLHRELGAYAASRADLILYAGEQARFFTEGTEGAGSAAVIAFDTRDGLEEALPGYVRAGDTVLVKASRSLEFEHTVALLETLFGKEEAGARSGAGGKDTE